MAGDKAGLVDQVRGHNLVLAETEMGNGHGAGFFGVVDKIALGRVVGLGADDLDGVLVGTDGTVGTETVEHGAVDIIALDVEGLVVVQAGEGHVIIGTDTEMVFRGHGSHVVEYSLDHGRAELGGTEAVATGKDQRHEHGRVGLDRFTDGGADIKVQGIADGARLLGAVKNGNALNGRGQGVDHGLGIKRPVEADNDQADFVALGDQVVDGGGHGFSTGTHDDNNIGGIRVNRGNQTDGTGDRSGRQICPWSPGRCRERHCSIC